MAVQNHLLSNTVLIRPDDGDDSDSSLQGETVKVQVNTAFKYPPYLPLSVHGAAPCDRATQEPWDMDAPPRHGVLARLCLFPLLGLSFLPLS